MKTNVRRVVGVVAVVSMSVALAACSTTASEPDGVDPSTLDITIAGVFGNTFDPFWTSIGCGAAAAADELGVTYKEFSAPSADAAVFDQSFNSATLIEPDGLFVNPLNPDQFVTQYQGLMESGVPVVTLNGTTPPAQLKIVGTDVENLDFLDELVGLIPEDEGTLAIIDGYPGLVPVLVRLDPVVNAILDGRPGLTALEPVYTGFDSAKATQAVSSLIIGNPNLRVIVASNGPDGAATAAAVKAAGKSGEITVIALDAIPPEVAGLKDGSITALVAQAPKTIGEEQLKALVDYLISATAGEPVEASDDVVGVPQKLLTADNVDDPANSAWVYTSECG